MHDLGRTVRMSITMRILVNRLTPREWSFAARGTNRYQRLCCCALLRDRRDRQCPQRGPGAMANGVSIPTMNGKDRMVGVLHGLGSLAGLDSRAPFRWGSLQVVRVTAWISTTDGGRAAQGIRRPVCRAVWCQDFNTADANLSCITEPGCISLSVSMRSESNRADLGGQLLWPVEDFSCRPPSVTGRRGSMIARPIQPISPREPESGRNP